ncbi:hypothetical protein [Stutzerimonas nitrititolerans]|uniref:hypothetical protein n=1 Tax=Stutzerimonas nitrititolerans TaxID=2482751 RepID=UPI00289E1071|nr:hypothetical protein [Stutzerimonas nitrititolerans]
MINLTNSLQILTLFVMSTVLMVIWSLPSAADLQATNSRVSELELRQTNSLVYLEGRHNSLEAKVIDLSNSTGRRLDRLEARTKQK